jgi:hypothetical protein
MVNWQFEPLKQILTTLLDGMLNVAREIMLPELRVSNLL